eukprot:4388145-Heterocapsa_arctica.AAC.1
MKSILQLAAGSMTNHSQLLEARIVSLQETCIPDVFHACLRSRHAFPQFRRYLQPESVSCFPAAQPNNADEQLMHGAR